MITGVQIRSARSALRWSVQELADRAGISIQTIKRFEANNGVPRSRSATLIDIKDAFEAAGVEFVGSPNDRPGIRIKLDRESGGAAEG